MRLDKYEFVVVPISMALWLWSVIPVHLGVETADGQSSRWPRSGKERTKEGGEWGSLEWFAGVLKCLTSASRLFRKDRMRLLNWENRKELTKWSWSRWSWDLEGMTERQETRRLPWEGDFGLYLGRWRNYRLWWALAWDNYNWWQIWHGHKKSRKVVM